MSEETERLALREVGQLRTDIANWSGILDATG